MMKDKDIIEGTPEWEKICEQCGICCLIKLCDENGNIFLTNVRCAGLDKNTRKCKCYAPTMDARDNGCENCVALGGRPVTRYTLNNEYVVPSFCPYAQRFCENNAIKTAPKLRPRINWKKTISQTEITETDMKKYVIPHSEKYFQYNQHVNKQMHDSLQETQR